jgi:hypothetical protein
MTDLIKAHPFGGVVKKMKRGWMGVPPLTDYQKGYSVDDQKTPDPPVRFHGR